MNHKITALTLQKRNRQRVNVYLDGEFAFGLSRFVAAWLEVGQEISDEKIAELRSQDAREVALQRALKYLDYRPRTEAEIRKHLSDKEVEEEIIDEVVKRLRRNNLVDDARFAENWVENRSEFRPRGKRALAYELRQRGIDRKAIDQVLEDVDEDQLAYQAALKQYRKYRRFDWPDFRKKMFGFLARRGFNYAASAEAIERVWKEKRGRKDDNLELTDPYTEPNSDHQEVDS